ncbi:MAG: hypothetical protein IT330_19355, partial [Anaerolineae bacterium]|nr:hypothetical protein [Anaerolineae bacterium]
GAFGLRPFAERADTKPWLKDLALTVILHGRSHDGKIGHTFADMTQRLEELALSFSPRRTLIKLVGFEGRVDHAWPHNDPDPVLGGPAAFDIFMATARRFGFHVMPHLNVWGASYDNPETKQWLPYQVQDQEGHPVSWSWDYDEDEIAEDVFAYISPDAPEWRAVLRRKVREMIERYGIDTIFLDQAGTFVNDRRYDHFRGLKTLYTELRADWPAVQFTGEGATHEISASLYPLLSGISGGTEFVPEMYRRLFGPYIRQHGHSISLPPEPYRGVWFVSPGNWWTKEKYEAQEARAAQVGAIPTLNLTDRRIRLAGEAIKDVMVRARQYAPPG